MLTAPSPVDSRRRRSVAACAAWLGAPALLGLAGCAPAGPLRIGFLGGMSGRVADLGVGGRNGARLAVDDLNAAGGINGHPVELLPFDDEQNPDVARRHLQTMATAGVHLVVGPMTSAIAVAVAPLAQERGMVLVSPTSTTHELTGQADAFFRVVSDTQTGGAQNAEHLYAKGPRTLACIADLQNRAFSVSWVQGVQQRFSALGGRTLLDTTYASAPGISYSALAQTLLAAQADVIEIAASAADTALLSQHIRQRNEFVQLATSPWAGTEQLLQMGGRAVEGALVPQYYDRSSRAQSYLDFLARFRQRFSEHPGYPSVNAYDATLLGAEALRLQRRGEALVDVMRRLHSFKGLQRPLSLNEFGDSTGPLFLTRVRNGQFEPIERT
ncbi:MAG TPA: ABC transporter substrate-binding protein [Rhizobacter sp.]|nr:ABC transporter substrate-binding protein [Rhizobacter sp.]